MIGFDSRGDLWLATADMKEYAVANPSLKVQPTFNSQLAPKVVIKNTVLNLKTEKLVVRALD